ncbi:MAG: response regulator [Elusimicrobia bacterium]|nr:response regulator [Elusimicrobiota bacterium]
MQEAVKTAQGLIDFKVVTDGVEAMAYLRGEGSFSGAARPSLILLDWRLPKKSGEEVLRDIRADPALRLIPVLVLTTSASERDVNTAYSLGANGFVTKPNGMERLQTLVSLIEGFWFTFASLPSDPEAVHKS